MLSNRVFASPRVSNKILRREALSFNTWTISNFSSTLIEANSGLCTSSEGKLSSASAHLIKCDSSEPLPNVPHLKGVAFFSISHFEWAHVRYFLHQLGDRRTTYFTDTHQWHRGVFDDVMTPGGRHHLFRATVHADHTRNFRRVDKPLEPIVWPKNLPLQARA